MSWTEELLELEQRTNFSREMGGPDKIKRQHDAGKMTVRERVDGLVDAASFVEVGALAGSGEYDDAGRLKRVVPSNVVLGRAALDGRPVVVVGDDFTVRGGANDGAVGDKMTFAEQMHSICAFPWCAWSTAQEEAGRFGLSRTWATRICRR